MNNKSKAYLKIAFGIILAFPALPMTALFLSIPTFLIGLLMLIPGTILLVLGIREVSYKRPELEQFPDEVVINRVHYSKSAFTRVDTFVRGSEKVFAIKELRQITGISLEEAKKVVDNWDQYY